MELILERSYLEKGVNSVLSFKNKIICFCIELPWVNNQSRVSCIPEGKYELKERYTEKFKHHWEVLNVKGRTAILIHPANNALKELKGCIAPVSKIIGEGRGKESVKAMNVLRTLFKTHTNKKEKNYLIIKNINNE